MCFFLFQSCNSQGQCVTDRGAPALGVCQYGDFGGDIRLGEEETFTCDTWVTSEFGGRCYIDDMVCCEVCSSLYNVSNGTFPTVDLLVDPGATRGKAPGPLTFFVQFWLSPLMTFMPWEQGKLSHQNCNPDRPYSHRNDHDRRFLILKSTLVLLRATHRVPRISNRLRTLDVNGATKS